MADSGESNKRLFELLALAIVGVAIIGIAFVITGNQSQQNNSAGQALAGAVGGTSTAPHEKAYKGTEPWNPAGTPK
ncbi:MAG: hypothetical protein HY393_04395 [Candidatus Diapherotrites archaeon]|nr:hypothetical protein [Candidatus Diapherotrites archaeon]